MKTKIVSLFLLTLIAFSCKKNDDLTVTLKVSGTLSVKVVDNAGNAIPNTLVKLYDYYSSSNTGDVLDAIKTDNNGNVNFGEMNASSYVLVVDTPKVNGIKYAPVKAIQVISASNKQITINVQEYTGTVSLNFTKDTYPTSPFSGLNVLLVPIELSDYLNSYYYDDSIPSLVNKAEFSGKTDAQGNIQFKIPSNRYFELVVFNDEKTNFHIITDFSLSKDQIRKSNYFLNPIYLD